MIVLAILDGWGLSSEDKKNAVLHGRTPFMDGVASRYPGRPIFAHGEYVGLPVGQMGNSEVGHLNIGGGREIRPDLVVINKLIETGDFYDNEVLSGFVEKVKARSGRIHIMGLLSDGGIHSHIRHLEALYELIDRHGPVESFLHAFLDGRDTEPRVGDKFIRQAEEFMAKYPDAHFRTIGGRSFGMDRDKNWSRIKTHYDAIVRGRAEYEGYDAEVAFREASDRGETDEFVTPLVLSVPESVNGCVLPGDGVIHFNFRADRGIQMTSALTTRDFNEFDVGGRPAIDMVTFTRYDEYLDAGVAFEGEVLHETLTEMVSRQGGKIFKIAETEKWAHVTKFFNGGVMNQFDGEDRHLCQSPIEVRPHYDKKPEMSADEIAEVLVKRILEKRDDLIVVNFANPDMVGHTGVFEAAVKAIETVDSCAERVYKAVSEVGGTMIIIADHGNAEEMVDDNGEPATKHTINPVPFYVLDENVRVREDEGSLRDVAPTILRLMGIGQPDVMSGISLVV